MHNHHLVAFGIILGATVIGCAKETSQIAVDTTASTSVRAAEPTPPQRDSATGRLALRTEAQQHFDAAREALRFKDPKTMASALRAAATVVHQQTDSAANEVKAHLNEVAHELDTLANRAESGAKLTADRLDRLFARANQAEAERHQRRSVDALILRDTLRAAEDMLMAVDHLERAARDARIPLDQPALAVAHSARALGADLLDRHAPGQRSIQAVQDSLGREIRQFGMRVRRR
ncbi:hypothetical protein [Gemmatimonas sp.]|jgi:hypothetical protein|uniref:hypothetical protein n=1 Tax=Gemmatimonas sp. TaxID=1962908 RepID=UPI0037C0FD4B